MKPLWIIKAGTTFPRVARRHGDFEAWTREGLRACSLPVQVFDVARDTRLPEPRQCAGILVTGSHAMVTDRCPWSVALEAWIRRLVEAEVPFFGICYGHQLLAQALGGRVDYHPAGTEIGTIAVNVLPTAASDPLFQSLPDVILANSVHEQTVHELPPRTTCLASNDHDPHQAFRVGSCAWGVQFHPEYDSAIMRSYIEEMADELASSGHFSEHLMVAVRATPHSRALLERFADFVLRHAAGRDAMPSNKR
ncbi:MAG: glutamine amidotransferase [Pirellulaceae bacterium]|jgi:GMP synthase (glutamine-hydrolysing)|nr:glutamine amidotransferase [Pirellulaceae bacterium]